MVSQAQSERHLCCWQTETDGLSSTIRKTSVLLADRNWPPLKHNQKDSCVVGRQRLTVSQAQSERHLCCRQTETGPLSSTIRKTVVLLADRDWPPLKHNQKDSCVVGRQRLAPSQAQSERQLCCCWQTETDRLSSTIRKTVVLLLSLGRFTSL